MKKKLLWMLVAMLFIGNCTLQAQTVIEDDEEEEEDDVEMALGEDEFAVTDEEGNEEVIEFPEAMTYDLDSLLNLYMSKTYLSGDNDCERNWPITTWSRNSSTAIVDVCATRSVIC